MVACRVLRDIFGCQENVGIPSLACVEMILETSDRGDNAGCLPHCPDSDMLDLRNMATCTHHAIPVLKGEWGSGSL